MRLHVLCLTAMCLTVSCDRRSDLAQSRPYPMPSWQTVDKADRISEALFGEVFALRREIRSLRHLPKRFPERENACPGPYRRTLLYTLGVTHQTRDPRSLPGPRMRPGGVLLFVEVRIGEPCIPMREETVFFGEIGVQVACYGQDCGVILDRLAAVLDRIDE